VRSLLVKLHPYVSCCASCGELKVPLEGRLCTSLAPEFPVDGVLAGGGEVRAEALRRALPWLRRVHVVENGPEALLHAAPDLAEHFFVAFEHSRPERIQSPLDLFTPNGIPLSAARAAPELPPAEAAWCSFLEKCGLSPGRPASFAAGIHPLTRECVTGFASVYAAFLATCPELLPEPFAALARWAYAAALSIPAGPLHPLLRHA
jgi:hypothetical protein